MTADFFLAQVSEGLDAASAWPPLLSLGRSLSGHLPVMGAAAVAVVAGIALSAFRGVRHLNGPADARNAWRLTRIRFGAFIRGSRLHAWGVVHDGETGEPLPYARVALCDAHHNEVAVAVSDHRGVYGFRVPVEDAMSSPLAVSAVVSKDGYFERRHALPLHAGAMPDTLDIGLERR